jgi:hypothetical protein
MGWLTWLTGLTSFPSQIQYAGGPVYCLDVLGFKVALLTSYLRIAGVVKLYRKIIIAAIVLCVANQLIFAFIISISCMPVSSSMGRLSHQGEETFPLTLRMHLGGQTMGYIAGRPLYPNSTVLLRPRWHQYCPRCHYHRPSSAGPVEVATSEKAENILGRFVRARILRHYRPGYSYLHCERPENIHRQQKYCSLVASGG